MYESNSRPNGRTRKGSSRLRTAQHFSSEKLTTQPDEAHTAEILRDLPTTGRVSTRRIILTYLGLILAAAARGAVLTSRADDWAPLSLLGLLFVLAAGSEMLGFEIRGLRLSGSFLSIVLAMALLGPAPAVALALACALSTRPSPRARSTACS